ncbi:ABC transporter ATP-binding protein [uncultured Traorella sp.]|uniref:ABC transporter ATP-binding protein n=1 Tax=uncultured Traorella sp. TaxID=1929048 RepID=UPI0025FB60D0|nr:ABC transporter ATP-binding protein [uncultured Traorella sp.]
MLKVEAVSKKLGNKTVLENCSLTVQNGSVMGLIGPNGAGKSTLLRCICDVYQCDQGSITLDGETIHENEYLKQNILYLSDDPYYMYNATIKDMKEFYQIFYPQFDEKLYEKYLKIFKLDENKVMNNFSKGMKRQAFILMALAISPKLLLLDESFDGLDPMMRLLFKRAIGECIEKKDISIIISSHNLRELEDICDAFAILEDAHIETSGMIDDTKEAIHKIQIAFREEKNKEAFESLDIMHYAKTGRIITLVVKGDLEEIKQQIQSLHPLMMDILPVNLEEIFIYEMERKGVFVNE